jgi:hypothetical protein
VLVDYLPSFLLYFERIFCLNWMVALAIEWAPFDVMVNAAAPTFIETELTQSCKWLLIILLFNNGCITSTKR